MNNMKPINAFLISLLAWALPFCNAIAASVKFLEKGEKKKPSIEKVFMWDSLGKRYQSKPDELDIAFEFCLLYTSPSPRDQRGSRMPSSA